MFYWFTKLFLFNYDPCANLLCEGCGGRDACFWFRWSLYSTPLKSCPLQDLQDHHSYQRWPIQLHSQSHGSVHSCSNSMRSDCWISASGQLWLPSSSFDCCHSIGQPRAGIFCPAGCFLGSIDVDLIRWAVCLVHRRLCSEESATSCPDRTELLWRRCCNG